MRSFNALTALLCGALTSVMAIPANQQASSSSSSATASTSSSTDSSTSLPGFVNNNTIGSYPCVEGMASDNPIAFMSSTYSTACPDALQPVFPYNKINLRAPDDSIRITLIPYGARLTEVWVKDRNDTWRDIIAGFDNTTNYLTDKVHPYFGPQVGRYANRIKNGTFEIDGHTYHTPLNEKNFDTLHGGFIGYDTRAHGIKHLNATTVEFVLHDPDNFQGFPGSVVATAQYTVGNNGQLNIAMDAHVTDDKKSPIMLSSHVYWALHGYVDKNNTVLDQTVHMPNADKYIKCDGTLIPTGEIPSVKNTPFDFQTPHTFNDYFNQTEGVCGTGCQGWDTCFVMSEHEREKPVLTLSSPVTGIQMQVKTDQVAIQLYTCDGISGAAGSIPRKRVHGGDGTLGEIYENHTCVVVEMEDYIDGINNPHWGRNQIYDKHRPYTWRAEYSFSANK